ncbi:MAG: DUF3995 domain-containing protein [Cyclobacteriaceae bacterium]
MNYLQIALILVFSSLSLLHFYWVLSGQWWLSNALPMNNDGQHVLHPNKMLTFIVALGLLGFASYYLTLLLAYTLPTMAHVVGWVIPTIFLLRAIGDFRYVGLFKKVKSTEFAKYDNRYYVPLCLSIAVMGVAVAAQL